MLAIPFLLLVFAVLETSISFTAEQVMNNAVDKLSRQIRTGQIKPATTSQAQFRTLLCNEIRTMIPSGCPEMEFDLQQYSDFNKVPHAITWKSAGVVDTSNFKYNPGGSGTINQLRVIYKWPVLTDLMKSHIAGLADDKMLLYASATWQNEPF